MSIILAAVQRRRKHEVFSLLSQPNCQNESTLLHLACGNGWLDMAKELINNHSMDPHVDIHGTSPLHFACTSGNIELVKYLINECRCNVLKCTGDDGLSTLHCAVMGGLSIVKYLLESFPYLLESFPDLHYHAIAFGKLHSSKLMLLAYYNWDNDLMKYLIVDRKCEILVNDKTGDTLLHYACRDGYITKLRFLIEECKCDPFCCYNRKGDLILHTFCSSSPSIQVLVDIALPYLLEIFNKPLNSILNASHLNALDCAIMAKKAEVVRCLLLHYNSMICLPSFKAKHVLLAYKHWDDAVMKCLIVEFTCSVIIDIETRDTVLHKACREMSLRKLKFLVEECNCDPTNDIIDKNKNTLLHSFCSSNKYPSKEILSYLHKESTKYSLKLHSNNHQFTPMELAICNSSSHSVATVRFLVEEYGAYELDMYSERTLALAYQNWSNNMMKYLLVEMKCNMVTYCSSSGDTILHKACKESSLERLKFLVESCHCSARVTSSDGETLIHAAVHHAGCFLILQYLCINCSCRPSLTCQEAGDKAIMLALAQKEKGLAVVKHLVEKCQVEGNCEIMSFAYENWCPEIVKYLIVDAGFGLSVQKDVEDYTILHLAIVSGSLTQLKFLIEDCNSESRINFHISSLLCFTCLLITKPGHFEILHYLCIQCKCRYVKDLNSADIIRVVQYCHSSTPRIQSEKALVVIHHLIEKCGSQLTRYDFATILQNTFSEELFKYLIIERKCSIVVDTSTGDTVLHKALHDACLEKDLTRLDFLLNTCHCDAKVVNNIGETVFHTMLKSVAFLKLRIFGLTSFIKKNQHIFRQIDGIQDMDGNTCLHLVCELIKDKSLESSLLNFILPKDTVKNLNLKNKAGYTVLHLLCAMCEYAPSIVILLKDFIGTGKCDLLIKDSQQNSILHILAKTKPQYTPEFLTLFRDLVDNENLNVDATDAKGNTVLHVACSKYFGDESIIERLLSTGKVNPFRINQFGKTPLMILDSVCRELTILDSVCSELTGNYYYEASARVHQLISRFGEVQIAHPIQSYTSIVLLGNPGAGKSTLAKVIEERSKYTIAAQFRNVKGVELHTAGIVPKVLHDKDLGRVILHDLAGQAEYYSSHTAVLENLLQGSAAVFVLVVSLANESFIKSFHQWLTIIQNVSNNALHQCHLIVVASHIDHSIVNDFDQLKHSITDLCSNKASFLKNHGVFSLDCRKLGGSPLSSFILSLSIAVKSISEINEAGQQMSLYCHMLYDFFQRDGQSVYTVESLAVNAERDNGLFLPKDMIEIDNIVSTLSMTGLIVYLRDPGSVAKSWIVADKAILLSHLNGVLFAPETFKQHIHAISSNTGIVELSNLNSIFPTYDPKLLLNFLQYMKLCSVISKNFIERLNSPFPQLNTTTGENDDCKYIFVPALIKSIERPLVISDTTTFMFGWCLRCLKDLFFLSRFLHLVQLHISCKFAVVEPASPTFERICNIWTRGIHWKDTKGVQALVELANNNQSMVVLMSCKDKTEKDMFDLIHDVIAEILSCKQQVMPQVVTHDYIIDRSSLPCSLTSIDNVPLYSVELLARCFIKNDPFILDTTGQKQEAISELVAVQNYNDIFEAVFAGRDPKDIAKMKDHSILPKSETLNLSSETTCNSKEQNGTYYEIFKSHTSILLGLISDPHKLANDLWSVDMLSEIAKDEVETNLSFSRYRKASFILNEIRQQLLSCNGDTTMEIDILRTFCNVLKNQDDPFLLRHSEKMIHEVNYNASL